MTVGWFGGGHPGVDALPGRPDLVFAPPSTRGAVSSVLRSGLDNLSGSVPALRTLGPRSFAQWLLLAPTFDYHGVTRAQTWTGASVPVPRSPLAPSLEPEARAGRRQPITGLVIAQDEGDRLPDALASLAPIVDEIVVVDGGSRDDTRDVARAAGAVVVERRFDRFDWQRNAGMERVRTPWAMLLDCDERVRASAVDAIRDATTSPCPVVIFNLLNYLGWDLENPHVWPDGGPRLIRRELRFSGVVHERPPEQWVLRMPLHENAVVTWRTTANAVQNHIRYTERLHPDDPNLPAQRELLAQLDSDQPRNPPRSLWATA